MSESKGCLRTTPLLGWCEMPTYDFKCQKCGHVFERWQRMSDPNPTCPEVHLTEPREGKPKEAARCAGATEKVFVSVPPAHFHGGGWAADNYHKKG